MKVGTKDEDEWFNQMNFPFGRGSRGYPRSNVVCEESGTNNVNRKDILLTGVLIVLCVVT